MAQIREATAGSRVYGQDTIKTASRIVGPAGSVADYVCDGTADNVEIQAAIDAVSAAGGGTVFLRAGTYGIAADLNLASNINLRGEGYATLLDLASGAEVTVSGKSNVQISNLRTDSTDHPTATDKAFNIINSSDVWVIDNWVLNCNSFGIFVDASASNTCQRVWIKNNYCLGRGNADVIGGGPQNSTGAVVRDVFIENNVVIQDTTISGTYSNAIDLVKVLKVDFVNNKIKGNLVFGSEQFPHTYSSIRGNNIEPAPGQTSCLIEVMTTTGATSNPAAILISDNILQSGWIYVWGVTTANLLRVIVDSNMVIGLGVPTQGIRLDYVSLGSVTNNLIQGMGTGIDLRNSTWILVAQNELMDCTTGVAETSAGNDTICDNVFHTSVTTTLSGIATTTAVYDNKGVNPRFAYAQGNVTGATTFNRLNGDVITATLTGNITVTLTNGVVSGDTLTLILTQDATGSRTATWPSNFKKAGGTLTLSTGASAVDVIKMRWDGTNWQEVARSLNNS